MRLERRILTGKDAVLSWKNILTSVFCIILLGVARVELNAQTTTQGAVRPNQYYQSSPNADRSSFRERLGTNDGNAGQNVGSEASRRPSTSSEIWSNFLFGGPQRQSSSMKFAFSRKTQNNGALATKPNSQRSRVFNRDVNPNQSVYAPSNADDRLNAMRQASESFSASNGNDASSQEVGASDSNESYVEETRAARRTTRTSNAEERRRRIAELNALLDSRASNARPIANDASISTNEAVARANRSMIRQTSALERQKDVGLVEGQTTGNANVPERESLPIRPQALQISPRVFVSSEVVQLPQPGALVAEETPEEDPLVAATRKEEKISEVAPIEGNPVEENVEYSIPTFNSQNAAQEETPIEAVAPLPLATAPQKSGTNGSDSRVLRSKAKFLDPRSI